MCLLYCVLILAVQISHCFVVIESSLFTITVCLSADGKLSEGQEVRRHGDHLIIVDTATTVPNCTVAYMSTCLSMSRCRDTCESMGAARYRWFHSHGCCECIGVTCLDYGKGEPLCLRCPIPEEEEQITMDAEYYDVHEAEKYTDSGAVDDGELVAKKTLRNPKLFIG